MAIRAFYFPEKTLGTLEVLADITDRKGEDRLATLIQDAVRVYEWTIFHQSQGKVIAALEKRDLEVLKTTWEVHGEREVLDQFFPPDKEAEVQGYFKEVA